MFEWLAPTILIRGICEDPSLTFERKLRIFSLLPRKCVLPYCPHFVNHFLISVQYHVASKVDEVSSDT